MEFFNDVGGDPSKPSLFELVAQEQLRDLLQPALKYVLSIFATRYPRYLLRVVNKHEEFYAFLMFFVERHYLRRHGASFAENFYGLKRRRHPLYETERAKAAVGGVLEDEILREKDMSRSLLFLVGLPYLRAKAQDYFEALGGGVDTSVVDDDVANRARAASVNEPTSEQLKRVYKSAYPFLNMGYELWLAFYNIAYLFDHTPFYRPWLAWMNVDLRRLGADDYRRAQALTQKRRLPESPKTWRKLVVQILLGSPRLLLDSLKVLLPTAIFFYKFLEWWYSPSSPARSMTTAPSGPILPPPAMLKPHPQGVPFDSSDYGQCPLCRKGIANATAVPSGYVFCYRCIFSHVEEEKHCPVTLLPTQIWQLRKVLV